jgi:hypothetical protein
MASSGMLRRVALVRINVSEELSASFIRVTRIGELGTTLAVTNNRRLQANYTDSATANFWRNLVPTFVDRGMCRGQRGASPTVVDLSFLDRSGYFSFKYLLSHPHKG